MRSGETRSVSLRELYQNAEEIADLILAPHERISIMRLLICITQRALNGPQDEEEKEDETRENIIPGSLKYLKEWESSFELLGEDGAFLQFSGLKSSNGDYTLISKLNISLSDGNNHTVFDNAGGVERTATPEQIAINLITFQNFATGGKIGAAYWNGKLTGKAPDTATAAPCIASSAIHTFIIADNLLDTLYYNLVPFDKLSGCSGVGVPVWEKVPSGAEDTKAITNATTTYLGRLVPISRCIKIQEDLSTCILAKGLAYPVYGSDEQLQFWESTMSLRLDPKKGERRILGADAAKAMWRSLPALLRKLDKHSPLKGGLAGQELPATFSIWAGAMIADKAKYINAMEDIETDLARSSVESEILKHAELLITMADTGAYFVKSAVKKYLDLVQQDSDNLPEHAARTYWGYMAGHKSSLMRAAAARQQADSDEQALTAAKVWAGYICQAARNAFNQVIPRPNGKQMRAWAKSFNFLPSTNSLVK